MTSACELARYTPGATTLLTLGVFDGVHAGHLSLIRTLQQKAVERALLPGVVTFSPHPSEVIRPGETVPLLMNVEERVQFITDLGIPLVVPMTFTRELSSYTPERFVQLLVEHLRMVGLILGPDFSLGRDREGTLATLETLGTRLGFTVESVPPFTMDGVVVSSTAIRNALAAGDVMTARRMLGRPYSLSGPITTTSRRGASVLGVPTANLDPAPGRALPRNGVYATIARVPNGQFDSVTNIGHRPTFGHGKRVVETHILDFSGHLYGASMTIEFISRIRDEATFPDPGALANQIKRDVEAARRILREHV
jgi:riboflavin kinase/FMN adenylyltransferase